MSIGTGYGLFWRLGLDGYSLGFSLVDQGATRSIRMGLDWHGLMMENKGKLWCFCAFFGFLIFYYTKVLGVR